MASVSTAALEKPSSAGDGGETVFSRPTSCHPESGSEAAYRCNPSTAALGWKGVQAHQRLGLPFAKPEQRPGVPAAFPKSLPWRGLERKLGVLRGSADSDLGGGGSRPKAFPGICGKPGSGKVFQSSQ